MKNLKRVVLALLFTLFCAACFFGCDKKVGSATVSVLETGETLLVIQTSDVKGEYTLEDCLKALSAKGGFSYEMKGTMLTSVNGKSNDDTTFSYWMIYTSDTKNSNESWGVFEWNNVTFASASVGVSELNVKDGHTYVLSYQTMSF